VARLAELAARAALECLLLAAERFLGAQEIVAAEGEVAGAQVAMVTEGSAERVERVGQRRACVRAQRVTETGAGARAAARSAST
jgi:hypothetical protein